VAPGIQGSLLLSLQQRGGLARLAIVKKRSADLSWNPKKKKTVALGPMISCRERPDLSLLFNAEKKNQGVEENEGLTLREGETQDGVARGGFGTERKGKGKTMVA